MPFVSYQGWGGDCSGKTQPGLAALKQFCATHLDPWGTITRGIYGTYNCRPPSLHGEGRALDVGFALDHDMPGPGGKALMRLLRQHGTALGVQEIIWDDVRYTRAYPAGREYTGPSPHYDHVHVSLNWDKARGLDLAEIERITGIDSPVRPLPMVDKNDLDLTGRTGQREVRAIQDALNWCLGTNLEEDGYWGTKTREAYRDWEQGRYGEGDGIPGRPGLRQLALRSGSFRTG